LALGVAVSIALSSISEPMFFAGTFVAGLGAGLVARGSARGVGSGVFSGIMSAFIVLVALQFPEVVQIELMSKLADWILLIEGAEYLLLGSFVTGAVGGLVGGLIHLQKPAEQRVGESVRHALGKCPSCGTQMESTMNVCSTCGFELKDLE